MARNASLYTLMASKHGRTVSLHFTDERIAMDTEIALDRLGFTVDNPWHGYRIERTACEAVETAKLAVGDL